MQPERRFQCQDQAGGHGEAGSWQALVRNSGRLKYMQLAIEIDLVHRWLPLLYLGLTYVQFLLKLLIIQRCLSLIAVLRAVRWTRALARRNIRTRYRQYALGVGRIFEYWSQASTLSSLERPFVDVWC